MLAILLYHLFISLTCLTAGFLADIFLSGILKKNIAPYKDPIVYFFSGIILIGGFSQITVLFFPINLYIKYSLWAILLVLLYTNRKKTQAYIRHVFTKYYSIRFYFACFLVVYWAMLLVLNSGPVIMDDTDSYHIQSIKWTQDYGTVPGLVNLHNRLGFNSSWFTFTSLFVPLHTNLNFFCLANGVVSLWMGGYLFSSFLLSYTNEAKIIHIPAYSFACLGIFLLAVFCWPMLRGNAANCNYDFISACMVLVLFIEVYKCDNHISEWHVFLPELLIWPVFLFTVRIINFPLLFLSFFAFIILVKRKEKVLVFLIISLLLVMPFITRNLLLSGYPLFPIYQVDLFSADWKANTEETKKLVYFIKNYNRVSTSFLPIEETAKLGFRAWVRSWFFHLLLYDKIILLTGILGYIWAFLKLKSLRANRAVNAFAITMLLQILSWFFVAPDPRFIYGSLLIGSFTLLFIIFQKLHIPVKKQYFILTNIAISLTLLIYSLHKVFTQEQYRNFGFPIELPVPVVKEIKLDSIILRIPEKITGNWNPRCFGTELPCVYEVSPGLKCRGASIRDGFKIEK